MAPFGAGEPFGSLCPGFWAPGANPALSGCDPFGSAARFGGLWCPVGRGVCGSLAGGFFVLAGLPYPPAPSGVPVPLDNNPISILRANSCQIADNFLLCSGHAVIVVVLG